MIQGLQPFELPDTPPASIEPGIRPLVDAINATGWLRTRQSCEGHPEREEGPWVWVQLHSASRLPELLEWMDRANALLPEWLIACTYIGSWQGPWFEVRGRYLRQELSAQIRDVLARTI